MVVIVGAGIAYSRVGVDGNVAVFENQVVESDIVPVRISCCQIVVLLTNTVQYVPSKLTGPIIVPVANDNAGFQLIPSDDQSIAGPDTFDPFATHALFAYAMLDPDTPNPFTAFDHVRPFVEY